MTDNRAAHVFAQVHGFYRCELWWIETFTLHRGEYYRYRITGTNGMRDDEPISWRVPSLRGTYAFRLRVIA